MQFPAPVTVIGTVNDPSGTAAVQWRQYSGPGTVTFSNAKPAQSPSATFSAPGVYTLMLSAADGLHAVAYDAVIIRSLPSSLLARSGDDVVITFATATGQQYRLERASDLAAGQWSTVADNVTGTGGDVSVPDLGAGDQAPRFYRVVLLP